MRHQTWGASRQPPAETTTELQTQLDHYREIYNTQRPHRALERRTPATADETTVTVIDLETSEILSTHAIDPDKTYWRNTQRTPGRWPGGPQ